MDERIVQLRVGLMVFVTLIITGILVLIFGELPRIIHGGYTVDINLPEAPGIAPDSPIRKSGILIGRVKKVQFNEQDDGVIVTAEIQGGRTLYRDEECFVKSNLLGDAVLQFVRRPRVDVPHEPLPEGEAVTGRLSKDPVQVITDLQEDFTAAIKSVTTTSQDMGEVVATVQKLLEANEEQITEAVDQANLTMKSIRQAADSANDWMGDPQMREQIRHVMADMPDTIRSARDMMDQLSQAMPKVQRNLDNMEALTGPLRERGPAIVARVDRMTKNLDQVMLDLAGFSQSIREPDGALGQLLNNPELYDNLNRAVRNVEELTRQLKPIVRDARIFSDKIARHPGIIVRDAIRPGPGIKRAYFEDSTPRLPGSTPSLPWQPAP